MILRILIWSFVLVMIFRFVVRFVLPLLQITRTAQHKIKEMQRQMEEMQQKQQPSPVRPDRKAPQGDYIEYEEVK